MYLLPVVQILVMTAAALSKMDTARLNTLCCGLDYIHQPRASVAFLVLNQFHLHLFARQPKGNKHRPTIRQASHSTAPIGMASQFNQNGLR